MSEQEIADLLEQQRDWVIENVGNVLSRTARGREALELLGAKARADDMDDFYE